jgi:hypothetical protein
MGGKVKNVKIGLWKMVKEKFPSPEVSGSKETFEGGA